MQTHRSPERQFPWGRAGAHRHHEYLWPAVQRLLPAEHDQDILDAGCGNGYMAGQLAALGHRVTGIDSSVAGIELARQSFPSVRFAVSSLEEDLSPLAPAGGWTGIVASEVIEHLWSPPDMLSHLRTYLRPDGWLLITTPYHGYLKNLAISLVGGWDRHFAVHNTGGHIKFFSPATLTRTLRATGLRPEAFLFVGRVPLLRKSMACRARIDHQLVGVA